jgi:transcriptional regulator with XRE-family HTH domain
MVDVGAKTVLDSSQLARRYTDLPLGRKLAERGVSPSKLAEIANVSRADVSHYLHGKRHKIGFERRRRIIKALCEMSVLKPRVRKPPVCKQCGLAYPTRRNTLICNGSVAK